MGVGDGNVLGKTKIVDNGPPADRWNMVILSDGYRAAEMAQFATDVQNFVDTLFVTPPFNETYLLGRHLSDAINVYRVDVTSTDSGADDPVACGGTGATPATYFDAAFCNGGIRRLLVVNDATVTNVVNAQVPQAHMSMVLVNSPIYGGSGGGVATVSKAAGAVEIALHEMGHTAFGLADEYEYWAGCGVDAGHNNHPASEPAEPNVTINSNPATIKWRPLIAAGTAVPTSNNADCSVCDPQPNPSPAGTVGAFEGAHYYHCDAFRPEFNCRMRALGFPFCAVCKKRIRDTLWPHMPPASPWTDFDLASVLDRIWNIRDWIADPVPFDLLRFAEVMLRGGGRPDNSLATDELSRLLERIDTLDSGELRTVLLRVRAAQVRLQAAADIIEAQIGKRGH